MTAGTNQYSEPPGNLPEASKGDTRDKVGASIGLSGKIYERGRAVVQAAQDEPEKYGYLIACMDREGVTAAYRGINPAFGRVQSIKKMEETISAPANPNAWNWPEKLDRFIEQETMHGGSSPRESVSPLQREARPTRSK